MGVEIQDDGEKAQEGDNAAGQGENEKLPGCVPSLRPPPDADQEEQRHQGQLKENIEENDVERQENADHAGAEGQEPGMKFRDALGYRCPRYQDRRDQQNRRQHHQPNIESIQADIELDSSQAAETQQVPGSLVRIAGAETGALSSAMNCPARINASTRSRIVAPRVTQRMARSRPAPNKATRTAANAGTAKRASNMNRCASIV